jgi:hypothetical protein
LGTASAAGDREKKTRRNMCCERASIEEKNLLKFTRLKTNRKPKKKIERSSNRGTDGLGMLHMGAYSPVGARLFLSLKFWKKKVRSFFFLSSSSSSSDNNPLRVHLTAAQVITPVACLLLLLPLVQLPQSLSRTRSFFT